VQQNHPRSGFDPAVVGSLANDVRATCRFDLAVPATSSLNKERSVRLIGSNWHRVSPIALINYHRHRHAIRDGSPPQIAWLAPPQLLATSVV